MPRSAISPPATSRPWCIPTPICPAFANRAAHHRARPRRLCLRHRRQALHRRHGGAVVHRARLRQRGAGRSRGGADAQASFAHLFTGKSHDPAIELAENLKRSRRCRSQRCSSAIPDRSPTTPRSTGLVPQQRARPAEQKENRQPHEGLSRRHHRGGVADRAAGQPPRFRPAAAGLFTRRCPHHYRFAQDGRARRNSPPALPMNSKR